EPGAARRRHARPGRAAASWGVLVADERFRAYQRPSAGQGPDPRRAQLAGVPRPPGSERASRARAGDEQGRPAHRAAGGGIRHAAATPDQIWDSLRAYERAGVGLMLLHFSPQREEMAGSGSAAPSGSAFRPVRQLLPEQPVGLAGPTWPRRPAGRERPGKAL